MTTIPTRPCAPWLLAGLSSVAFASGHGAQGRVGVVVTGALGFGLGALFVVTERLPAVVLAHYLVNALSFPVNDLVSRPGAPLRVVATTRTHVVVGAAVA